MADSSSCYGAIAITKQPMIFTEPCLACRKVIIAKTICHCDCKSGTGRRVYNNRFTDFTGTAIEVFYGKLNGIGSRAAIGVKQRELFVFAIAVPVIPHPVGHKSIEVGGRVE